MMVTWRDYAVKQEQYLDQIRQADKQRLIRQVTAGREESGLWQAIKERALEMTKGQPTKGLQGNLAWQRK